MRIELEEAVDLLARGEVVGVPTDTVYGLAADPTQPEAVDRLLQLKGRPKENPMILLLADRREVLSFVDHLPQTFDSLAERFWPGALTLIIPIRLDRVAEAVRAGRENVGFRVPGHPLTRVLLERTGPLVVTSANLSGRPAALSAEGVEVEFGAGFPVVDSSELVGGIESTILLWQGERWVAVRVGSLPLEAIEEGVGYRPERLASLPFRTARGRIRFCLGAWAGSTPPEAVVGFIGRSYPGSRHLLYLGELDDPAGVARRLYEVLREAELLPVDEVWIDMNFPREGLLAGVAEGLERYVARVS